MLIEVMMEDDRWQDAGLAPLAETAAAATLSHLGLDPADWAISILACDDARIAELNAEFRDRPTPTNVLSWPSAAREPQTPGTRPDLPVPGPDPELGDIAIAHGTCAREAEAAGKSFEDHVTHLVVHAVLHLLGYDHVRDRDATVMEATEIEILGKLGIADPY
ncbi:rRNA maturation RNase YbeY [Roseovarius sp. D22-M7]|uniref:rRNA maturation RNase YbeY n=1 Tax=Roseovarius sp. D22-M7 TaxID=3127116 RepID=UPI00301034CC